MHPASRSKICGRACWLKLSCTFVQPWLLAAVCQDPRIMPWHVRSGSRAAMSAFHQLALCSLFCDVGACSGSAMADVTKLSGGPQPSGRSIQHGPTCCILQAAAMHTGNPAGRQRCAKPAKPTGNLQSVGSLFSTIHFRGTNKLHKQKDPTNHRSWNPPWLRPYSKNVGYFPVLATSLFAQASSGSRMSCGELCGEGA